MGININEVLQSGAATADNRISNMTIKKGKLSANDAAMIQPSNILKSKYGMDTLYFFVAGAIVEYHHQLRETLLEKGIDIGELEG